ncbi:MAG: tyrosine-type recombinase/integrase [Microbacterium gubbeenense]|uniref:tyrosine-type recombinase/integrase n=1 Tax=Microbacterium gubbeenense TaxID=159896 RepID=UPI003F963F52
MKSASTSIGRVLRTAWIVGPKITDQSLRRYYATTLLRTGTNVRVVQEMMGHASLATTKLYLEISVAEMSAAASALPFISSRSSSRRTRRVAA